MTRREGGRKQSPNEGPRLARTWRQKHPNAAHMFLWFHSPPFSSRFRIGIKCFRCISVSHLCSLYRSLSLYIPLYRLDKGFGSPVRLPVDFRRRYASAVATLWRDEMAQRDGAIDGCRRSRWRRRRGFRENRRPSPMYYFHHAPSKAWNRKKMLCLGGLGGLHGDKIFKKRGETARSNREWTQMDANSREKEGAGFSHASAFAKASAVATLWRDKPARQEGREGRPQPERLDDGCSSGVVETIQCFVFIAGVAVTAS